MQKILTYHELGELPSKHGTDKLYMDLTGMNMLFPNQSNNDIYHKVSVISKPNVVAILKTAKYIYLTDDFSPGGLEPSDSTVAIVYNGSGNVHIQPINGPTIDLSPPSAHDSIFVAGITHQDGVSDVGVVLDLVNTVHRGGTLDISRDRYFYFTKRNTNPSWAKLSIPFTTEDTTGYGFQFSWDQIGTWLDNKSELSIILSESSVEDLSLDSSSWVPNDDKSLLIDLQKAVDVKTKHPVLKTNMGLHPISMKSPLLRRDLSSIWTFLFINQGGQLAVYILEDNVLKYYTATPTSVKFFNTGSFTFFNRMNYPSKNMFGHIQAHTATKPDGVDLLPNTPVVPAGPSVGTECMAHGVSTITTDIVTGVDVESVIVQASGTLRQTVNIVATNQSGGDATVDLTVGVAIWSGVPVSDIGKSIDLVLLPTEEVKIKSDKPLSIKMTIGLEKP